jgi:hypothetical protein
MMSVSVLAAAVALVAAVSPARAEDAKGSISGKVVDSTGAAVKAGKVLLMNPNDATPPGGGRRGGAAAAEEGGKAGGEKAPGGDAGGAGGRGGGRGQWMQDLEKKAVAKGDITDGAYKVTDVPAGKYVLIATAQGSGMARTDVTVTAGQETKVDELKLQQRGRGGRRGGGEGGNGGGNTGGNKEGGSKEGAAK